MIPVVPAITSAALCERRRLVDLKGATFLRGKSLRAMQLLAEGGDRREARDEVFEPGLEWVWNVALNPAGGRRDLRFWPRELLAPQSCRGLKLPQVINLVLPAMLGRFAPSAVVNLLLCEYQHLSNLKAAGQLPPGAFTSRAALVTFLTQRLMANKPPRPETSPASISDHQLQNLQPQTNS